MRSSRICIVTPDLAGPTRNGGIGTHCLYLARFLVRRGARVTILHTGHPDDTETTTWKAHYRDEHGAELIMLDELPPIGSCPIVPLTARHTTAHRVDRWLRQQAFDEVHFQDWQGNGAIATRAKAAGAAHLETRLIVTAHGSSEWIRAGMGQFPQDGREGLVDDALERMAVEAADVLICPSAAMRGWLTENGWALPADSRVIPYLFETVDATAQPRGLAPGQVREIIFFGRLETRKGLEPFLAALERLAVEASPDTPDPILVHFVGKPHDTTHGPAEAWIADVAARCASRFACEVHPDLDHGAALAFLRRRPHALVVMPSLADNLPFAVIECIALGMPLLASARGGIPELIASPQHLVEPTAQALAARLGEIIREGLAPLQAAYSPEEAHRAWQEFLNTPARPDATPLPPPAPRVSVCIPHFNQPDGLATVLTLLAEQSAAVFEVVVVDDGSASQHGTAWQHLADTYRPRGWQFLTQSNAGPAVARNAAAAAARGDVLIFCDADNRPHRDMVARLTQALVRTGADVVTCGFVAFTSGTDGVLQDDPAFQFSPLGGAVELGLLENFIGDVNLIVGREAFLALGGFDASHREPDEDWEFLLRVILTGKRVATLPDPLFDYRIAPASRARQHAPRAGAEAVWARLPAADRARYLRLLRATRGTFERFTLLQRAYVQADAEARATARHADNLTARLNAAEHHESNLRARLDAAEVHQAHLRAQLEATRTHAHNLEAVAEQHALTQASLAESERRANALLAEKYALESARAAAAAQVTQLSERASRLSFTIHELRHDIMRRKQKLDTIESSVSWRITQPLRYLRRKLIDPYRRRRDVSAVEVKPLEAIAPPAPPCSAPGLYGLPHSVDEPRGWTLAPRKHLLRGWVFHPGGSELRGIRAVLGARVIEGIYGLKRLDVAASVRGLPQAEFCGWRIDVDLTEDDTELELQALEASGVWLPFFRVGLRVGEDLGPTDLSNYEQWLRVYDTRPPEMLESQRTEARAMPAPPLISILLPVYNTPERWLRRAIQSVCEQTYPHWELCIADDASTLPHVRAVVEELAAADGRIKVALRPENGHISAASNSALELATGEFVGLLDHDDELAPHALFEIALVLGRHPQADLVYSDEDKIDEDGRRFEPYFKPDWNPDLILGQNYLSHFSVYRTALVREVGAFRVGYEGSQDWDLALRVTDRSAADRILHIPKVLYHWRAISGSTALELSEKSYPVDAARRALADHFAAKGIAARLEPVPGGHWRTVFPLPDPAPLVSLIIPTRNGLEHLRRCVDSITAKTDYPAYEILIVDNGSDDRETIAWLRRAEERGVRVLPYPEPFNYAAINNTAVRAARGEIVTLLNNDLEVINAGWLTEMVSHACREGVGCVGAMLYFPNDMIQHAGVILGVGGVAGHAFRDFPRGTEGVFNRARLVQSYSAVTAACMSVRKAVYLNVGGMDEDELAVAFNDIDFCLKVRRAGLRNIWTPFAELYHHESASRGADDTPEKRSRFDREVEVMLRRWGTELTADPAYNPNLSLERNDFSLAIPPRPARI